MNSPDERILGMLGLAKRAGKLISGTDAVLSAVTSQKRPFLCVCASDASERTRKQLADKCAFHNVELVTVDSSKDGLARAVGKKDGQMSACAVCDRGMAEKIILLGKEAAAKGMV